MMNEIQIDAAPSNNFDEALWAPLIEFFWDRYTKRYFNQIAYLQKSPDKAIRNNCGFLITSLDFTLIETLSQFYNGEDETKGKNHDPVVQFFSRSIALAALNFDATELGKFTGYMRSGLLHQSKTKKGSVINIKKSTPIVGYVDPADKNKGFKLNRNLFHAEVYNSYVRYIDDLKIPASQQLRNNFKSKLKSLL